jgi:hypothetical protein
MIDVKRWGEFMFALWKKIKAYETVKDWTKLMDEADKMMEQFPEPVFRSMILAFLEQKSMESIRNPVTKDEIEIMNATQQMIK